MYTKHKKRFALELINILYLNKDQLNFEFISDKFHTTRKTEFDDLPEKLQYLLQELQKKHIIDWDHRGFFFKLERYNQHKTYILNKFSDHSIEYKVLEKLIEETEEKTKNRYGYSASKLYYYYNDILPFYDLFHPDFVQDIDTKDLKNIKDLKKSKKPKALKNSKENSENSEKPGESDQTSISSGDKKGSYDESDRGGGSARSDPQLFRPKRRSTIDSEDLYEYLRGEQWSWGVWVSKADRVHNLQAKGRLDTGSALFRKLEHGLGVHFSPNNGQCYVVHAADGLGFSWQLTRYGYIHFWFDDSCSWELFMRNLRRCVEPCNLTHDEFKELLETLKTANTEEEEVLFEVANDIGPEPIIERFFNKSALIYHKVPYEGKYYDVLVKIDKSKGPFEIEFIGPEGPTKNLQDLTVRPFEVCQSLSEFQFIIENLVESSVRQGHAVHKVITLQEQVLADTREIKQDIRDQGTDIANINTTVTNNGDTLQVLQTQFKDQVLPDLQSLQEQISDIYHDIRPNEDTHTLLVLAEQARQTSDTITELIETIKGIKDTQLLKTKQEHEQTRELVIDLSNEVKDKGGQLKNEIITRINDLDFDLASRFDNLQQYIKQEFADTKAKTRNSLYLILRKLDKMPGRTAKEIHKELNVSKRTVYNYLNTLRQHGLIEEDSKKLKTKGRPAARFKLNLSKLIKKLKN